MNNVEQRAAAKAFAKKWDGKGDEKQDAQSFWIELLSSVLGVKNPTDYITFEKTVVIDGHTKYIDGYISTTKVLIEQKSIDVSLEKAYRQSDGTNKTPYQQARNYANFLPHDEHPRWIIVSNFKEIHIHDMNHPNEAPISVLLEDLEKDYYRITFLVNVKDEALQREMKVSEEAGALVGILYDKIKAQYLEPDSEEALKSLNKLCVRLVFCLYAEDAGIFGRKNMFHDYIAKQTAGSLRDALIKLFRVLNQKPEERDKYLDDDLNEFPYVNGGLFRDEDIEIPRFTDEILKLISEKIGEDFDWSDISPTIFGAMFESTLNPETRRSGGMHYTSIENIHKVIDPLFLNDLKEEFHIANGIGVNKTRIDKLNELQRKLSRLKFLDPACGSGNFLTESYISLRRLENEIIAAKIDASKSLLTGQIMLGNLDADSNPIQISIGQFYGIEVNDFAVTVATTALWIAENQMMKETEDIIHMSLDFLPLKSYTHIIEENALTYDWEELIPKNELSYIMGNPPFVGGMYMQDFQKAEIVKLFSDLTGAGELDFVCGWYKKAAEYIQETKIKVAFVSTNSICQGIQVITFWKYIIEKYNIHIDYAYTTFVWNSEAHDKAKVHCVIVGFSAFEDKINDKFIFTSDGVCKKSKYISPYLTDTEVCFIETRSNPICNVPAMRFGSMPRDGGGFILSPSEKEDLICKYPLAEKWIKPYVGAEEFLKGKERYCLWLVDASPTELQKCPDVMKRVENVRNFRASSKAAATRKFAETPTLFCQIAQPDSNYIMVPSASSGTRRYVPLGFKDKDTIASNLVFLIPNAGLYEFGILMSNVHNAWLRLVAGRLKSDYRYSKDIVYNNFPWPTPTPEQRQKIEETAQGILDARALFPNDTLASMYDPRTMPPALLKAHQANDRAVLQAYKFPTSAAKFSEEACVAELMKLYQKITK